MPPNHVACYTTGSRRGAAQPARVRRPNSCGPDTSNSPRPAPPAHRRRLTNCVVHAVVAMSAISSIAASPPSRVLMRPVESASPGANGAAIAAARLRGPRDLPEAPGAAISLHLIHMCVRDRDRGFLAPGGVGPRQPVGRSPSCTAGVKVMSRAAAGQANSPSIVSSVAVGQGRPAAARQTAGETAARKPYL